MNYLKSSLKSLIKDTGIFRQNSDAYIEFAINIVSNLTKDDDFNIETTC